MTHTPTPWTEGEELIVASSTDILIGSISSKNDRTFIIEACNNYEKLKSDLATLKASHAKLYEALEHWNEFGLLPETDPIVIPTFEILSEAKKLIKP